MVYFPQDHNVQAPSRLTMEQMLKGSEQENHEMKRHK